MVEERIPTMPQTEGNEERIPTMPQVEGNEERIPTMPQTEADADGRIATVPQQNGVQSTGRTGKLVVTSDVEFTGDNGGKFTIESQNVINSNSGESQIYGCHKASGNVKYVARVLISVTPESSVEKRLTRDKVITFLERVSKMEDSHILPLIDNGVVELNGKEHYVEVYPFCEEGDLGKRSGEISYQELVNDVIPAVNEALNQFHKEGLVHRDIKPDNLYRYKGKVVVADFGITCDLREDGFATDKNKTGTLGYYAPELMSQAALKASDYYSFGQTLWTLYSGEMMYHKILRRFKDYGVDEQRAQINNAMLNNTYFGLNEIKKADEFFEVLIKGLLQYDVSSRFDYEQVNRWLNGDRTVGRTLLNYKAKGVFEKPFPFHGEEYWEVEEIYQLIIRHWQEMKELLYSNSLKNFFDLVDQGISGEINKIAKTYSTLKKTNEKPSKSDIDAHNDIGLCKLSMLFSKNKTFVWRGVEYTSLQDVEATIRNYVEPQEDQHTTDSYDYLLGSDLLKCYYKEQATKDGTYDKDFEAMIDKISELAQSADKLNRFTAYVTLMHVFHSDASLVNYRGHKTMDDVVKYISDINDNFYDAVAEILNDGYFYGFLYANGYEEAADYLLQNKTTGKTTEDVELLFELLHKVVEDKQVKKALLECYVKKGPSAHLYWWQQHLNLYSYNSREALELKNAIENQPLVGRNLTECRKNLAQLDGLSIKFRDMFVDNIFLAQLGINDGKTDITSTNAEAYWHYDFFGKIAPVGFYAYIEKGGK